MISGSSRWSAGSGAVLAVLCTVASSTISCGGSSTDDLALDRPAPIESAETLSPSSDTNPNQVLEWNQIFIETLIATDTRNSSSQRLGAILHTAIFDAHNGIEGRYTPIHFTGEPEPGASRRAAVIQAAYEVLLGLFPRREAELKAKYLESLAALSDDDGTGGASRSRGISYGHAVAEAVLDWRAGDGFSTPPPDFFGGTAIGQWRPLNPTSPMSAQALAFTAPFVVESLTQFLPAKPRDLHSQIYTDDLNAVKALGGKDPGSTRTPEQGELAEFWEGNASVHWNQAANQAAAANDLSLSDCSRLLAILNIAMADTSFTTWYGKLHFGEDSTAVTWRPFSAIQLAAEDGNPDTDPDPTWLPFMTTPNHPEYPAGHPSLNGAAATVMLLHFADVQTFTLTTTAFGVTTSRLYDSITRARGDGNDARVWGGMHYPSTVAISDAAGATIAAYVNAAAAQPVHRQR